MIDIKFPQKFTNKSIEIRPCGMYLVQTKGSKEKKLAIVAETEVFYVEEGGYTSHSDLEWFKDVYDILRDVESSIKIDMGKEQI